MGSGRCIVHIPLPLWATTWAMYDALCMVHCHCGQQDKQWKMHGASSDATAGDSICNIRSIVHGPLQLLRQNGQWNMHCVSSTATAGDNICCGGCIVHLPLLLRATKWAMEDALCIFHCNCWRQHGQWKMHCASYTATAGYSMGSGRCIVHRPLQLWATTWAVEDALCIFHCNCGRQHGPSEYHVSTLPMPCEYPSSTYRAPAECPSHTLSNALLVPS